MSEPTYPWRPHRPRNDTDPRIAIDVRSGSWECLDCDQPLEPSWRNKYVDGHYILVAFWRHWRQSARRGRMRRP